MRHGVEAHELGLPAQIEMRGGDGGRRYITEPRRAEPLEDQLAFIFHSILLLFMESVVDLRLDVWGGGLRERGMRVTANLIGYRSGVRTWKLSSDNGRIRVTWRCGIWGRIKKDGALRKTSEMP